MDLPIFFYLKLAASTVIMFAASTALWTKRLRAPYSTALVRHDTGQSGRDNGADVSSTSISFRRTGPKMRAVEFRSPDHRQFRREPRHRRILKVLLAVVHDDYHRLA